MAKSYSRSCTNDRSISTCIVICHFVFLSWHLCSLDTCRFSGVLSSDIGRFDLFWCFSIHFTYCKVFFIVTLLSIFTFLILANSMFSFTIHLQRTDYKSRDEGMVLHRVHSPNHLNVGNNNNNNNNNNDAGQSSPLTSTSRLLRSTVFSGTALGVAVTSRYGWFVWKLVLCKTDK